MAPKMVDPAFETELPHKGVNPGEACTSILPALEPGFGLLGVDVVGASWEVCGRRDGGG